MTRGLHGHEINERGHRQVTPMLDSLDDEGVPGGAFDSIRAEIRDEAKVILGHIQLCLHCVLVLNMLSIM